MERVAPDEHGLQRAAEAIRSGCVVAYPTETVYGLGVDPSNSEAIDALFAAKGRKESHAVLLIGASLSDFEPYASRISPKDKALMDAFWPGPLSLVLPACDGVRAGIRGDDGGVCVRIPASETARALCRAFGGAITSTSANRSGDPPAEKPDGVPEAGVQICVDGGVLKGGAVSTVYNSATGTILREGVIDREHLQAVEYEWDSNSGASN